MTPASIIAQMRRIVKVDTSQYTDANALIDLNTLKDEFWSAILTSVPLELYNWQSWIVNNSVAQQSEYNFPAIASNSAGSKIITGLALNYNGEYYDNTTTLRYVKARQVNPNGLEFDWDYYVNNQSQDDPIYFVADKSVFIAPSINVSAPDRLKINGVRKIADYTLLGTEDDMKIPVDQQQALVFGLAVFGHFNKGSDDGVINNADVRWATKKQEAIKTLESRDIGTTTFLYPDQERQRESSRNINI